MLRKSTFAHCRRFGSPFALAFVLAAGGVLGSAAIATPAYAKDKKPKEEQNTREFGTAYRPMADAINAGGDKLNVAKEMIPGVEAAIGNETDKFVFANALIALGAKLKDTELQKEGIAMSLETGKTAPEQVGLFNFFLGQWAYQDKNWTEARNRFQKAQAAGYTEGEPDVLVTETYFGEGKALEGLTYFSNLLDKRKAAGVAVPDQWIMRGLKIAVDSKLAPQTTEYSVRLVENNPTQQHWSDAIAVVSSQSNFDQQGNLDMLRLLRATGALTKRNEYIDYVNTAAAYGLPSEVLSILSEGKAAGVFSADEDYYKQNLALAQTRSAKDARGAADEAADARKAPTGVAAQGAGDLYFSLGNYAKAAEMYQLAIDKGPRDRELSVTRLGIAQILAGQADAGKATLSQVTGARLGVAKMWIAYADLKAAGSTGAAPNTDAATGA